ISHCRDQQIQLHRFRGDAAKVLRMAEEMAAFAKEQGFRGLAAQAKVFKGWAMAKLGDPDLGVRTITEGLDEHMALNTPEDLPVYYEMAAEAYGAKGEPERGLPLVAEAITIAERTGLQTWLAELFRRKGLLLLQQSFANKMDARACFARAVTIAGAQGARALVLRALCDQMQVAEGPERAVVNAALVALCNWLTEGFDFVDVVKARRLLDEL